MLTFGFAEADHGRIAKLAERSNAGTLTEGERRELQGYVFVADVLSAPKSKARLSLRKHTPAA